MTDGQVIKMLCEFFLDEFSNDPGGVGDWVAQNGDDIDEFLRRVHEIKNAES